MTTPPCGYQYVVLRCVPRVDRDEFVNVGVIVYCQARAFLDSASRVDEARLRALHPDVDVEAVRHALAAIEAVCAGHPSSGDAAGTPLGARFGWLSAPRSTVVQPGPIHGGLSDDPADALQRLLEQYVG